MNRRLIAGSALVVVGVVTVGHRVEAHAELMATTPAANAVLETPPTAIELQFTEAVDLVPDAIRLVDSDGVEIEIDAATQDAGADTLTAAVADLPDSGYVVAWKAVSADSHPIQGAFAFTVGDAPAADPAVVDQLLDDDANAAASWWLDVGRWLSYGGIAGLLGVLTMLGALAPDVLTGRRAGIVLMLALAAALLGTLIMIAAQSAQLAGSPFDPDGWRTVLESRSGVWWILRLLSVAALIPLVVTRRTWPQSPTGRIIVAVISVWLLAIVAAGGHSITGRAVALGFVMTVAHLVAMTAWAGGLLSLAVIVPSSQRWAFAVRFSPLALAAVVTLALSGTANALRQNALSGLTTTSYGRWLLVKLVLVAVVVAVAVISRRLVRAAASPPTIAVAGSATVGAAEARSGPVDRRLRRSVIVETAGIALVLAATAGLVNSPPPTQATTAPSGPASAAVTENGVSVQVTVDPPVTGGSLMHVYVTSADPAFAAPDEITVEASLPSAALGPLEFEMTPAGPQHVFANDANFPVPGTWAVTVTVRYGDFDQAVFELQLDIR